VFIIPEDVVNRENLPSNEASVVPIKDLLTFQEGMALKIAPHLSAAAIEPSHFDKMKVSLALNVFSKATSAGLKYMVQQENRPLSYLTTAWFLEQVDRWFDLMSSRHPITALSRLKMEEYQKAIIVLQNIVHLFRGIKIGQKGGWKPVQTGVIMATTSILAIQEEMLTQGHREDRCSEALHTAPSSNYIPVVSEASQDLMGTSLQCLLGSPLSRHMHEGNWKTSNKTECPKLSPCNVQEQQSYNPGSLRSACQPKSVLGYQRTVVADSQTVCEVQRLPLRTVQQMRSGLARKV
ncbi:hypothetical protein JOQ06_000256, partial [Pogonophryne albipinna]